LLLSEQITDLTGHLRWLLDDHAPALMSVFGAGPDTIAQLLITAGDNPDRLRSEAHFAALAGACPIPASSGKTQPAPAQPAPQHRVEPTQQVVQRLVQTDLSAQRLDFPRGRLHGLFRGVDVDVVPLRALLPAALCQPKKSRPSSMWVTSVLSGDRRRPIVDNTSAISSRSASASDWVPLIIRHQSSA